MATTSKAIEMASELSDKLAKRLAIAAVAVAQTFDSLGNPIIQVGTGADGAAGAILRIIPISWPLAKDILGLAATVFTPHVLQICTEAAAAADLGLTGWNVLGPLLKEADMLGTRSEYYVATNGNGGTKIIAAIGGGGDFFVAANLKASVEANLYHGMLSSQ